MRPDQLTAAGLAVKHGTVAGFDGDVVIVVSPPADVTKWRCELLNCGEPDLRLAIGDEVLFVTLDEVTVRGVILGRIGASLGGSADPLPDELVLEAKTSVTFRVGEGSITIREDGKILIKGKDLVSHATRRNRIRGGSVEIN